MPKELEQFWGKNKYQELYDKVQRSTRKAHPLYTSSQRESAVIATLWKMAKDQGYKL